MKVKELLADESKWVKGSPARTKYGGFVGANHPAAICWCLVGAVLKCYSGIQADSILLRIRRHIGHVHYGDIAEWNDSACTTFSDVRKLVEDLGI